MKLEEFKNLQNVNILLTAKDLINHTPRTLLYGYDIYRNTVHTYLDDNLRIITLKYGYKERPTCLFLTNNHEYVPSKRLYPERCDMEFCKLLISLGINLPFTTFNEEFDCEKEGPFFGEIL